MKKIVLFTMFLVFGLFSIQTQAQIKREHRSIWISAYVTDWPANPITTSNEEAQRNVCRRMLDSIKVNNFNVVYYHVRAMCDAMYESSYEPWSSYVSGERGKAPAFDPFAFMIEAAHERGIEVYAWINPYRYSMTKNADWGQSPLDYINSHPDWLVRNDKSTYMNPGLPEVTKRVVDVSREIVSKYDVDGFVFDDYFYNDGGLDNSADKVQYQGYVESGGQLDQAAWRRNNINSMVQEVHDMIKSVKPWVRFGIGPAGVAASDPKVAEQYGVPPCPGSDWQYKTIHSDPLAWVSSGSIDFISPQLYWHIGGDPDFAKTAEWWGMVSQKFNRHLYVSYIVPSPSSDKLELYSQEIDVTRNVSDPLSPGHVYFKWATLTAAYERINGKIVKMMPYFRTNNFQNKALPPTLSWDSARNFVMTSDIIYNDGVLRWKKIDNMRYVVYAVPESTDINSFRREAEYIIGVCYDASFSVPKERQTGYKYAVAVMDRYGNEYAPLFAGANPGVSPEVNLTYPGNGEFVKDLFNFSWSSDGLLFTVQISEDAEMTKVIYTQETDCKYLPSTILNILESGKTYYWRVISSNPNAVDKNSEVRSFSFDKLRITSVSNEQKDIPVAPLIKCDGAIDEATYQYEIWKESSMINNVLTETSKSKEFQVPEYKLSGGSKYYMRVVASYNGNVRNSDLVTFYTEDIIPSMPTILTPSTDGGKMFSNSNVALKPEKGVLRTFIEISGSDNFPVRSSYVAALNDFNFNSDELGKIKISGSYLGNGKTYYLRARYGYVTSASTSLVYTDYTPVLSFVYDSGVGVETTEKDGFAYIVTGPDPKLVVLDGNSVERIEIYSASGSLIKLIDGGVSFHEYSLSSLLQGEYLVKVTGKDKSKIIKFVR